MGKELSIRDDTAAVEQSRDFDTRVLSVRVATADIENRSVEAILSTDREVEVFDWRMGETVGEILLGDAVELPRQLPLLAVHSRYSLDDVLGSVRDLQTEDVDGSQVITGRLHFAEGDDAAERAWSKVRQGHLTDISVGYRVKRSTEIEKGQTATVGGREFTATSRRLRVVTEWNLREASLVPIGADEKAKTRSEGNIISKGAKAMNPELRTYLESIGLRAEATDAEAWQHLAGLEGDQRAEANNHLIGDQTREESGEGEGEGDEGSGDESRTDVTVGRDAARDEERARVVRIRELAGADVPQDTVDTAISEGWDESRASQEFLGAIRGQRMRNEGTAPAGHSTSRAGRRSANSLAAGMLIGNGMEPVGQRMHNGQAAQRAAVISERDADQGDQYSGMSAIDIVRECVLLDTGRNIRSPEEAIRAAVSGTSLTRVFTTNVYASLMRGWDETPDTTGWCQTEDVPNFLTQEAITLEAQAYPEKHPRGSTAKHATMEDTYEQYKIGRYSKQFVVDEQDIIDDRLGALTTMAGEMGAASRRLRPDLVYAVLLANADLVDTGALFNSTAITTAGGHANLTTAVLGSAGLKAAITAMGKLRIAEKVLNIRPKFLIVPVDLQWTAMELLNSGELRNTTANTLTMTKNVLAGENLQAIVEDRIGAAGVTDPNTGTASTGSATNWFLAANGPGSTVKVAYRRGTGRSPQLRSFQLDKGQWGVGWDINLDIGVKSMDYRGLHKSTGAG